MKPLVHPDASKIFRSVSDHGNQLFFLNWVTHRAKDSDIEEDELKMCPLIWCRKTFETNELAVRHVSDCSRLLNAWYWCPFHRRPERFLECKKGCEIVPKPRVDYAFRIYNWFDRRRLLRSQTRAAFVNDRLFEADHVDDRLFVEAEHGQESKELAGNQIYESPGSDTVLSTGKHRARAAGWVNEKAGYPGHQSRIFEVYGSGDFPELTANPENST